MYAVATLFRITSRLALPLILTLGSVMTPALARANTCAAEPVSGTLSVLADGFRFTEGPVWYQNRLLFSDVPASVIYAIGANGKAEVFRDPSGWANGNATDSAGQLVTAQHDGRVTRTTNDGTIEILAATFQTKRLNSPNDVVVGNTGTIFFTDPIYGIKYKGNGPEVRDAELPFRGIYRIEADGTVSLLSSKIEMPNGIGLSPDEQTLYVTDSEAGRLYRMSPDNPDAAPEHIATLKNASGRTLADGLDVASDGRIYVAGVCGVWIFDATGQTLGLIATPDNASNVRLDPDRSGNALTVTAGKTVYRFSVTEN